MLNINTNNKKNTPSFKGALDTPITGLLRTLDTNPMANAVGIDLFAMVAPRTYVDTKERNKYAGAETFFREFTGTLIVCLSASYLAKVIAKIANKIINPSVNINPKSWFSNDSIAFLEEVNNNSKDTNHYVSQILESLSGKDGKVINKFSDTNWANIEWVDEKRWSKFKWQNKNFQNINQKLKDKNSIINAMSALIENKTISPKDSKQLFDILELRITNILKADSITAKYGKTTISSSLHNLLRDAIDMGRDVYTNPKINKAAAISKILKINRIKSIGALTIAAGLGLSNQYINRKITEKRTGTKGFVGDTNYDNNVKNKKSTQNHSKKFLFEKILASLGMAAMAITVMKVKSPADFLKKLEFTGPVTSGNAIKTVYAATLIGRFLASDSNDELRETVTRDYLGFLNWLVLGGFAAKGMANILDPKRRNLFNIHKEGKGIKNRLNNISLKSHNEIAAKGSAFAKKNMWKLNVSHAAGLAYSTLTLGYLLPKLNIFITKHKQKNKTVEQPVKVKQTTTQTVTFGEFFKVLDSSRVNTSNIA